MVSLPPSFQEFLSSILHLTLRIQVMECTSQWKLAVKRVMPSKVVVIHPQKNAMLQKTTNFEHVGEMTQSAFKVIQLLIKDCVEKQSSTATHTNEIFLLKFPVEG